jgi:hypothetical protein
MRAGWNSQKIQLRIGDALLDHHKYYGQNLIRHGVTSQQPAVPSSALKASVHFGIYSGPDGPSRLVGSWS